MERFRKIAHATRVAIVLGILAATPAAAATYDGSWSVQIASQSAACGDGATIPIGIRNGQVASTTPQLAPPGPAPGPGHIPLPPPPATTPPPGLTHASPPH